MQYVVFSLNKAKVEEPNFCGQLYVRKKERENQPASSVTLINSCTIKFSIWLDVTYRILLSSSTTSWQTAPQSRRTLGWLKYHTKNCRGILELPASICENTRTTQRSHAFPTRIMADPVDNPIDIKSAQTWSREWGPIQYINYQESQLRTGKVPTLSWATQICGTVASINRECECVTRKNNLWF